MKSFLHIIKVASFKKILITLLLVVFPVTQVMPYPVAYAINEIFPVETTNAEENTKQQEILKQVQDDRPLIAAVTDAQTDTSQDEILKPVQDDRGAMEIRSQVQDDRPLIAAVTDAQTDTAQGEILKQVQDDPTTTTDTSLAQEAIAQTQQLLLPRDTSRDNPIYLSQSDPLNQNSTIYDLIVLVVDSSYKNLAPVYPGLTTDYPQDLRDTSIKKRIERFAEDIRTNNTLTDVKIIYFDKETEKTNDIASALENLYLNGTSTNRNKLSGVIFIGDIPLPVVNKAGNRYVSMFPYTDFVDKAYIYNPTTDDFERNTSVVFPKIETWHGVIKEPCFSDFAEQCPATSSYGRNQIATFLDKNHLYYLKNPDFYNVDKKMFFADLINEEKKLVPEIYKYYLRYLDGLEDQSYMRYNKFWAYDVLQSQTAGLDMGESTDAGENFSASLNDPKTFQDMPDTYAKQIIDQSLIPYYSLMKKFVSVLNNWADYTGRYTPTDILNVPVLMTMKDEAAKYYLKSANDALEKKINEIAQQIQEPITILEYSKLTGELAQNPDPNGDSPAPFKISLNGTEFPDPVDNLVIRYNYKNEINDTLYLNGIPVDLIESPKLCSVYLGSTKTNYFDENNDFNPKAVDGEYSILTRSMRSFDPATAYTAHTIGVNTQPILLEDEAIYGDYFHGELIADNVDYGVPAFYPNYLTNKTGYYNPPVAEDLRKGYNNPWEGTLQKGDIIVEVNEYPLKPKFTLKEAIEQVYQNKAARYKEAKENDQTADPLGTIRIKFFRNGVLQPTAVKTYELAVQNVSGETIVKDVLQKGNSDAAMFALYLQQDDTSKGKDYYGFGGNGFDISAGCNFQASGQNSNRCFYNVAMMPVLSPAGSETFIKDSNNNGDLMFPENIQKHYDEDLQKAVNIADDSTHRYSFQYPDGYSYEDIDKLYMDSCFNGLPSIESENKNFDSNPYSYPMDSLDQQGAAVAQDVYGKLLRYIGEFVSLGEMTVNIQKYNKDTREMEEGGNQKINADSIALPPVQRDFKFFKKNGDKSNNIAWLDIDSLGDNYEDIVLNSEPAIYLASFSSRYGLFDKVDNDNDGQTDEFDERTFGLPQKNLGEIFRKMFSKNAEYTIPAAAFPESTGITTDVKLKVEVAPAKTLSSVILHNEPTNYTISQEVKSMSTKSLPIDNPRYVAFQSKPTNDALNYGRIQKIVYPNLFRINNAAQLIIDLEKLASEIADMPGAYRVFGRGANENNYTKEQIKDHIVNELYNVVQGTADSPASGIDLVIADEQKLADFTKWAHLSVDDKHEYILKYYLNPNKDAYIQDSTNGFEVAYLVLDGSKDYFNMMFNKDISAENQENYVLPTSLQAGSGTGLEDSDASGGKNKKFTIPLWDLLKEFKRFLEDVKKTGQITGNACVFSEKSNQNREAALDEDALLEKLENEKPLNSLELSVDKKIVKANGEDKIIVNITGYDSDGNIVGERSNYELLTLTISDQNVIRYTSADKTNLINGSAAFTLKATQTTGSAVISVSSKDTNLGTLYRGGSLINSNSVKITSSGKNLRVTSYVYYVPEGMEELLAEISGSQVPIDTTPEVIRETPIEGEREPLISIGEEPAGDGEPSGGQPSDGGGEGSGEQPAGGEPSGGQPVSRPIVFTDFSDIAPQGEPVIQEITDSQGRQVQIKVRRFVDGYAPMSDSSANAPMDQMSQTLFKEFVKQVLYYSTRAKEISDILKEHTNWEQFYINTEYYQKYLRPTETWEDFYSSAQYYQRFIVEPQNPWEEIFSTQKYYERYLQEAKQESRILLAALASDITNPINGEVLKQVQDDRIAALASDFTNPVNGEILKRVQDDRINTGPLKTLSCPLSDSLNPFVDEMLNSNSMFSVENSNAVIADELILTKRGRSMMKVEAEVIDANGALEINKISKIKFTIKDINSDLTAGEKVGCFANGIVDEKEMSTIVDTVDGVAKTYFRSGKKAGSFKITAEVIDELYPVNTNEYFVSPNLPSKIDVTSDSYVLVANNESKTTVYFTVKDKFGNVVKDNYDKISVFISSDNADVAKISQKQDADSELPGIQIDTKDGVGSLEVLSQSTAGGFKIISVLTDSELEDKFRTLADNWTSIDFTQEIGSSRSFEIFDKVELRLTPTNTTIDILGDTNLGIEMVHNNARVLAYNGPVSLNIINSNILGLDDLIPFSLTSGFLHERNIKLNAKTLAGDSEIIVTAPGFASATTKIKVLPSEAVKIKLTTDSNSIYTNGGNEGVLKAELLDQYDNLVNTDNSTNVGFYSLDELVGTTSVVNDFLTFLDGKAVKAAGGIAQTRIKGKKLSGTINMLAQARQGTILSDKITLKIQKHLKSANVKEFAPKALYMSLLGGDFGNPINQKNLAQTLLYSGSPMAVSSLTAEKKASKRLFSVNAYGKTELLSETVKYTVVPSTDAANSSSYQKINITDAINEKELASVMIIPKTNTPINIILPPSDSTIQTAGVLMNMVNGIANGATGTTVETASESTIPASEEEDVVLPIPESEGIYIQKFNSADKYELSKVNNEVLLKNGDNVSLKINRYGKISVPDSLIKLALPDAENAITPLKYFSFVILENKTPIGVITYKQNFEKDVSAVSYDDQRTSFYAGVYLKTLSSSSKYKTDDFYSGSSTSENKGKYLVDTESEIDAEMAPGFSYTSLEKAGDSEGIGFKDQNKFMLFYAAGNSVGESNQNYASEIGIIYGDPTFRLETKAQVSKFSGFTKDIGTMAFSEMGSVKEMVEFDFNGDGFDDILLLYEDGGIRLLENKVTNKRFVDRGFILNIPGGANTFTKIDYNNDSYDDILVGTKESCVVGEECFSLYTNLNGYLKRETLNFNIEGKPVLLKTGDGNADGCDDIFVSDESGNIRIFYNNIIENKCVGYKNSVNADGKINYDYSKNYGFAVNPNKNSVTSLFVYYSGLPEPTESTKSKYLALTLPSSTPPATTGESAPGFDAQEILNDVASMDSVVPNTTPRTYAKEYNFINISRDPKFNGSSKYGIDIDGEIVKIGDTVQYNVTLKNNTSGALRNVMLSDGTPLALVIIPESLKCEDENCSDNLQFVETGLSLRAYVIKNISIPANSSRRLSYQVSIQNLPKVTFELGHDFMEYKEQNTPLYDCNPSANEIEECGPNNDTYLDILIKKQYKADPNEVITYLYSTGLEADNKKVKYTNKKVTNADLAVEAPAASVSPIKKAFGDSGFNLDDLMDSVMPRPEGWPENEAWPPDNFEAKMPDGIKMPDPPEPSEELQKTLKDVLSNQFMDMNYNGLVDSYDPFGSPELEMRKIEANLVSVSNAEGGGGGGGGGVTLTGLIRGAGAMADAAGAALRNVAAAIENITSLLRCAGAGCLPIPYNYAFLAPNMVIPGLPVVAWGIPFPPFVSGFWPTFLPSAGRFYISPSLTGGMGIAVCVGPSIGHMSPCWAFALPIGAIINAAGGNCDFFTQMITKAIASAKRFAQRQADKANRALNKGGVSGGVGGEEMNSDGESMAGLVSDGSDPSNPDLNNLDDISIGESAQGDGFGAAIAANIRIPGFPAFITDWIDKQTDEIYLKLFDLPDFYFLYPDFEAWAMQFEQSFKKFKDIGGKKVQWQSFRDVLSALAGVPLFQIEGKDVMIKFPMISKKEIWKYKSEYKLWLEYERNEWKKWSGLIMGKEESWNCKGTPDPDEQTLCDKLNKFKADFTALIKTVESVVDTLDKIEKFPLKIMQWRTWEEKYARQIICYLDAIMKFIGGYIRKQMKIMGLWIKVVEDIIRIIKDWKMILDLVFLFKVTCDECKNDRFSLLGILLQLLIVIPSPPIIPLPKWPDFVFDVSNFYPGIKIVWPDLTFQPEYVTLPHLPIISVPDIPFFEIKIPGWVLDIQLPELPELPDLPPLPIPFLPDLPRPPIIPKLPDLVLKLVLSLKPIFLILCLLKKALMPVLEAALAIEIETLTQSKIDIVLAIIAALKIQLPAIQYDYVEKIKVNVATQVTVDIQTLYLVMKYGADYYNTALTKLVAKVNEYTNLDLQMYVDAAIAKSLAEFGELIRIKEGLGALGAGIDAAANAITPNGGGNNNVDANGLPIPTDDNSSSTNANGSPSSNFDNVNYPSSGGAVPYVDPNSDYQFQGENMDNLTPNIEEILSPQDSQSIKQIQEDLSTYAPVQQLKYQAAKFNETINEYIKQIENSEPVPDTYYLTAEVNYIDKNHPLLNRTLADIEQNAKDNFEDIPSMGNLANLRSSLIAYTKNLQNANTSLENIDDPEQFFKVLAEQDESVKKIADLYSPKIPDPNNKNKALASLDMPSTNYINDKEALKVDFFDQSTVENFKDSTKEVKDLIIENKTEERLIALDQLKAASSQINSEADSGGSNVVPKGFYVLINGVNENILAYNEEFDSNVNFVFTDFDHDGDSDIILSMGGNIYIKENFKKEPGSRKGALVGNKNIIGDDFIKDFTPQSNVSVQSVSSTYSTNKQVDVDWMPQQVNAYEVIFRKSMYDSFDNPAYRFIALTNPKDNKKSKAILKKINNVSDSQIMEIGDKNSPSIEVAVENGNYFVNVFSLNDEGQSSLVSNFASASATECADKEAPMAAVDSEYQVSILRTIEIDASSSFDSEGMIAKYFVEILPYANADRKPVTSPLNILSGVKKIKTNALFARLPVADPLNPLYEVSEKFFIGNFVNTGDVGDHEFILYVVDESGNSSKQKFKVNVYVPDISLDAIFSRITQAIGKTTPESENMPFSLIRQRMISRVISRKLTLVKDTKEILTPSSKNGKYYTNVAGEYNISDFNLEDMLLVENDLKEIVAEIHPNTGNIGNLKDGYKYLVFPAIPPVKPTRIDIVYSKTNKALVSIYLVADPNIDVETHVNTDFETLDFMSLHGVHVNDPNTQDNYSFIQYPSTSIHYPGGTSLYSKTEKKNLVFIDSGGNIILADKRIKLDKRSNDHRKTPIIIEMKLNNNVIGEAYISASYGDKRTIIVGPDDVPYASPAAPSSATIYTPENLYNEFINSQNPETTQAEEPILPEESPSLDTNVDTDYISSLIDDFVKKGIIQNPYQNASFNLDGKVKRSEFVKTLLEMLCIIPRKPDAYTPYSANEAGGGFSDIIYNENNLPWYYPYVKEGALRSLVNGYIGEMDRDPVTGLAPFKPENNITRAEAVKIIIQAIAMQGVIDNTEILNQIDPKKVWYEPFMKAALDLTPYMKKGSLLQNNFIITAEEYKNPEEKVSYLQLMIMVNRVLQIYNCFEIDDNNNGMSDYCERKYDITDPNEDFDGDGAINSLECANGTNPREKDSDNGGANDFLEELWGTNPLDSSDDGLDNDFDGLTNEVETLIYQTDYTNPDTDGGGVIDGDEAANNTDPLNGADDIPAGAGSDGAGSEGENGQADSSVRGLYIVPADCDTCPCFATLLNKSDVLPGDVFFSVIFNSTKNYIFKKSEEVAIESVSSPTNQ